MRQNYVYEDEPRQSALLSVSCLIWLTKPALLKRIALIRRDGTLEGISDLRDESDRQGNAVDYRAFNRTAEPEKIACALYKKIEMHSHLWHQYSGAC